MGIKCVPPKILFKNKTKHLPPLPISIYPKVRRARDMQNSRPYSARLLLQLLRIVITDAP